MSETKFLTHSDNQILELFNNEVGNKGWTTSRSKLLNDLSDEMISRGWDTSAIMKFNENGTRISTSFKHKIRLEFNKVITI